MFICLLPFIFTHFLSQSKGGILSKACDYIQELRQSNHSLFESLHEMKRVQMDNEILRQQVSPPATSSALPTKLPRQDHDILRKKYLKKAI